MIRCRQSRKSLNGTWAGVDGRQGIIFGGPRLTEPVRSICRLRLWLVDGSLARFSLPVLLRFGRLANASGLVLLFWDILRRLAEKNTFICRYCCISMTGHSSANRHANGALAVRSSDAPGFQLQERPMRQWTSCRYKFRTRNPWLP